MLVAFTSSIAKHYIRQKVESAERVRTHLEARLHRDQAPDEGGSQSPSTRARPACRHPRGARTVRDSCGYVAR